MVYTFNLFLRRSSLCSGFGSGGSGSDDAENLSLRRSDDIQQRNICRTAVEAATALDTILDCIGLQFLGHAVTGQPLEQLRLKAHRTCVGTFAATDTVSFNAALRLFLGEEKQC